MTRREFGFLLIGLGVGLILATAATVELVLWFQRAFIFGPSWRPGSAFLALLPFLLVLLGSLLLFRRKSKRDSN
jgi:uncharacterized membrane protein